MEVNTRKGITNSVNFTLLVIPFLVFTYILFSILTLLARHVRMYETETTTE